MTGEVFVEYYSGSEQVTICKVVNSGGDLKTLMVPAEQLGTLIQQLNDVRFKAEQARADRARQAQMDSLA